MIGRDEGVAAFCGMIGEAFTSVGSGAGKPMPGGGVTGLCVLDGGACVLFAMSA